MSLEHSPARQRKRGGSFAYDLLTLDDVAERLRCSRKTVKQSYRRWGLRPVRIARRVLIPSDQLVSMEQQLIERGETI